MLSILGEVMKSLSILILALGITIGGASFAEKQCKGVNPQGELTNLTSEGGSYAACQKYSDYRYWGNFDNGRPVGNEISQYAYTLFYVTRDKDLIVTTTFSNGTLVNTSVIPNQGR